MAVAFASFPSSSKDSFAKRYASLNLNGKRRDGRAGSRALGARFTGTLPFRFEICHGLVAAVLDTSSDSFIPVSSRRVLLRSVHPVSVRSLYGKGVLGVVRLVSVVGVG